ncbi:hypothetical protein ACSLO3_27205, partial [Escherichia coli]
KRHALEINPCSAFEVSDAGGKEVSRDRWLTRDELIRLFEAMRYYMKRCVALSTIQRQEKVEVYQ